MNRIIHFEIHADDIERARTFYKAVFGWEIEKWPNMEYWMVMTGPQESKEPGINGGMVLRSKAPDCPPLADNQAINAFACTVQVENIDEIVKKVLDAGGKIAMPKFDIGGMAYQAYCKDTEGNTFGLHELIKKV